MTVQPHPGDPTDPPLEQDLRDSRRLEAPPEHVLQRAFAVWRPRAAAPSLLRQLLATLSFDSGWVPQPALGTRGAGARQRQMLFTVEGLDLDLRITPQPDGGYVLGGQVLGPETRVSLTLASAAGSQSCTPDALGEFRFQAVPGGECRLRLQHGDAEVELPPIDLQA